MLDGAPVGELSSLLNGFLIVDAFYYGGWCGDVTVIRGDVETVVRHDGCCPKNVNQCLFTSETRASL
jgi:hypothetical protein